MNLEDFYENWDGDVILSEVSKFKDENDFLDQAQKYVNSTREPIPIIRHNVEIITIVANEEGEWYSKLIAEEEGFEGKELIVYRVNLDMESVGESYSK